MISKSILDWLLDGDPSIQWQTLCDLAAAEPAFRENIFRAGEGRKTEPVEYASGFESASMV